MALSSFTEEDTNPSFAPLSLHLPPPPLHRPPPILGIQLQWSFRQSK